MNREDAKNAKKDGCGLWPAKRIDILEQDGLKLHQVVISVELNAKDFRLTMLVRFLDKQL